MLLTAGAAESWFSVDAISDIYLLWCFNHWAKAGVTGGVFVFLLSFSHLIFSHSYMGTFTLCGTQKNTGSHAQEGMSAKTEPLGSRLSGEKGQVSGPSVFHQACARAFAFRKRQSCEWNAFGGFVRTLIMTSGHRRPLGEDRKQHDTHKLTGAHAENTCIQTK